MPPSPEVHVGMNDPSEGEEAEMEEMFEIENEIELGEDDYNPADDDDDDDDGDGDDGEGVEGEGDEENGYLPDDAMITFREHKDSVFCVAFHPSNDKLVISGGQDDHALLWHTEGDRLTSCSGDHRDSVVAVGFSADGRWASSVDMSGVAQAWNVEDGARAWHFECPDVEWARWHTVASVLLVGCADGDIYMFKVPSNDFKICLSHGCKTTAGAVLPDGKRLISGYEDGSAKMWDLKTNSSLFTIPAGDAPVSCLATNSSGASMAIGSLDGVVRYVNDSGKVLCTLSSQANATSSSEGATAEDVDRSVESITFSPDDLILACAHINGSLFIWDLASKRIRHECRHPHGISLVLWHLNASTSDSGPAVMETSSVITAGLDGIIRAWDWREGTLQREWNGHQDQILDMRISVSREFLATSSDDNTVRIFKL